MSIITTGSRHLGYLLLALMVMEVLYFFLPPWERKKMMKNKMIMLSIILNGI